MKKGRVVILLAGRLSGKKAIIIKQNDEGKKVSRFSIPAPHTVLTCIFLVYRTESSLTPSSLALSVHQERSRTR